MTKNLWASASLKRDSLWSFVLNELEILCFAQSDKRKV